MNSGMVNVHVAFSGHERFSSLRGWGRRNERLDRDIPKGSGRVVYKKPDRTTWIELGVNCFEKAALLFNRSGRRLWQRLRPSRECVVIFSAEYVPRS